MFNKVSEFVQDALYRKYIGLQTSQAILWGSINSVVLTILLYDIQMGGLSHSNYLIWWCSSLICIICSLNIIVHLKSYLTMILTLTPLEVNDKQRKLLSVTDSDIGFKSPSLISTNSTPVVQDRPLKLSELFEATIRTPPPQSLHSTAISTPNKSWYGVSNSPSNSYNSFNSANNSMFSNNSLSPVYTNDHGGNQSSPSVTANSWSFHRNQSSILETSYNSLTQSPIGDGLNSSNLQRNQSSSVSPNNFSALSNLSQFGFSMPLNDKQHFITTKDELNSYMKDFSEKERKRQILSQNENGNGGSNSLWSYNSTINHDIISSLKKNVYQPAIKDAGQETSSSSNKNEDFKTTSLSSSSVSKIWRKRDVTPKNLFQFEENLRIWLSMNVLQPLVNLIDLSNETIAATAPELQIGSVGVDKLKKAAQNMSGVKQLSNLLPFLDLTVHQDYLVQRLHELSKGGAISTYQWNAGGSFNGKPWREEYPTDTLILLHLFAMYMDNHLPPDPTQPDGRVFSNVHIVKTPEKPQNPATHPCLYLTQMNPPHIKVILPGEEECDVGSGHKNFFHSLLLFSHHLVHQQHSHIAGVNLNLYGINLAWVLNSN